MEADTWNDAKVAARVRADYVPLLLDGDGDRDQRVIERLNVEAFPTTLVFTPKGELIDGAVGYLSAEKADELWVRSRRPVENLSMKR